MTEPPCSPHRRGATGLNAPLAEHREALVAALRAGDVQEAVEVCRRHVDILHRAMFMGLTGGATASSPAWGTTAYLVGKAQSCP